MNEPALPDDLLTLWRARTPARVLQGRVGTSYRTSTRLELGRDHSFARDAVGLSFDASRDFGEEFCKRFELLRVESQARDKTEFLRNPERGRRLSEEGCETLRTGCAAGCDLQIVIGDGLSTTAVRVQVPVLLPLLIDAAQQSEWRIGRPIVVRHCRVGILNDVGDLLQPEVVVLLIGERPGLATAESLSAYMAYRPQAGHTDAQRNLISNIHSFGVPPAHAVPRIVELAEQMRRARTSGSSIKERLAEPALPGSGSA